MVETSIINKYAILNATKDEAEGLETSLMESNIAKLSFHGNIVQNNDYIIKDNEKIIAGIRIIINFEQTLYIKTLCVDAKYRKQGLGSRLIQMVEANAQSCGVKMIYLATFSFQAKNFYLKHGYEIFASLDYYPAEYKLYYLKKIL